MVKFIILFKGVGMEVKIKIIAEVNATVELLENETVEGLCNREVDIYLHGISHIDKIDLGADKVNILVLS